MGKRLWGGCGETAERREREGEEAADGAHLPHAPLAARPQPVDALCLALAQVATDHRVCNVALAARDGK